MNEFDDDVASGPDAAANPTGSIDPGVTARIDTTGELSAKIESPAAELATPSPVKGSGARAKKLVGVVAGLALVVGGGAFAVSQIAGKSSNTPQEAVQDAIAALEKSDMIGLAEALAPGERDALIDSVVPMVDQLKRLEVLDTKFDLKNLSGLQFDFTDLTFETAPLRDDLAAVTVTGGSVRRKADAKAVPFGAFIRDVAGEELAQTPTIDESNPIVSDPENATPIVALKTDGHWYVSLGYTAAHATGAPVPAAGSGVPARGAATPEDAVRDLMLAAANLDVRRLIELAPPDELAALHDYADQFLPDAESGVQEVKALADYKVTFPGMTLTSAVNGDRALVKIAKIGIDVTAKPEDGPPIHARFVDDCATVEIDGEVHKRCGDDLPKLFEDITGEPVPEEFAKVVSRSKQQRTRPAPNVGIAVVKRNGAWYVSPTRTSMDMMTATLAIVTKEDMGVAKAFILDIKDGSLDDPGNLERLTELTGQAGDPSLASLFGVLTPRLASEEAERSTSGIEIPADDDVPTTDAELTD